MSKNFWQKLKKSFQGKRAIYALAPMAGITDSSFRQICLGYGADVVYSEMASAAALFFQPQKTIELLVSSKQEKPYIIQLFGSDPKHFAHAVKLLSEQKVSSKLGIHGYKRPQGFDINFGCPVKKAQKQGAGAVLMKNNKIAREIIIATTANTDLPVSIKCRCQVGQVDVLKFLWQISDLPIQAVMIHGRSLTQGHSGPVDGKIIREAKKCFQGVVLANGGVDSLESAQALLSESQADGLGIGQGVLGKPWLFEELKRGKQQSKNKNQEQIFNVISRHARLVQLNKGGKGILEFRKHLCWYIRDLPGAKAMRQRLIKIKDFYELYEFLK